MLGTVTIDPKPKEKTMRLLSLVCVALPAFWLTEGFSQDSPDDAPREEMAVSPDENDCLQFRLPPGIATVRGLNPAYGCRTLQLLRERRTKEAERTVSEETADLSPESEDSSEAEPDMDPDGENP